MSTVLVTRFAEDWSVDATLNLAWALGTPEAPAVVTSVSTHTLYMDLALCDYTEKDVRALRARFGLLELLDEYMAIVSDVPVEYVGEWTMTYGSLTLSRPSTLVQRVPASDAVVALPGAPRAFSSERPLKGTEWRVDWPELWRDWAGAAFGAHVLADLQSEAPAVVVDCDGATDLGAAERWAELVDLVVVLVGAGSESGNDRAAHYVRHVRERAPRAKALAIPLVRVDTAPERVDGYLSSYRYNFHGSVPAERDVEGIWDVALPDVSHTVVFSPLPLEEPRALRESYDRLAATVQRALATRDRAPRPAGDGHSGRAEAFADARRRVRWDVFIAYSSDDTSRALALREYLRGHHLRAFLASEDMARTVGAEPWRAAIERTLKRSEVLVVLVSGASIRRW